MADDDPEELLISLRAFRDLKFPGNLRYVQDGANLIKYLNKSVTYFGNSYYLIPDLVLLDLKMLVKNGWKTLKEIKNSQALRNIPVAVWATSNEDKGRSRSIETGADYFLKKPDVYADLLHSLCLLIEKYCGNNEDGDIEIPVPAGKKQYQ